MSMVATQLVDSVMAEEQTEPIEENEEAIVAYGNLSVRHEMNMFKCILKTQKILSISRL